MSPGEVVLVVLAGVGAGIVNAVVGSGTLITFPVLLAAGYPPVVANVSNSIGLVPGSIAGALGYRDELRGQRRRLWRLGVGGVVGGAAGAVALLVLPEGLFAAVVPGFVAVALVLVVLQPRLKAALAARRASAAGGDGAATSAGMLVASVYGGYFGAAQGIIYIAILSLALDEPLQRVNALKNVLTAVVNAVAGCVFVLAAHVAWTPVLLIAIGSAVGGRLGGRYGRLLPPTALRALIVLVGVVAIWRLVA